MVKNLARACLRLVTLIMPVFIAACYGVPTELMRYSATGKVIDKDSHDPISDIQISCLDSRNALQASATSLNGDFSFYTLVQGSIRADDFKDVWENRFREFVDRRWMKTGQCASCGEFRHCRGNSLHLWDDEAQRTVLCHHQVLSKT